MTHSNATYIKTIKPVPKDSAKVYAAQQRARTDAHKDARQAARMAGRNMKKEYQHG